MTYYQRWQRLQQRGFLLGVVTNRQWGGKTFREDLEILGLLEYFQYQHMAISADLGVRKPHPAIFQHALNALCVAPEEAVMVGNSLRADIVGAQRSGIFTIWKPKPGMRNRPSSSCRARKQTRMPIHSKRQL